MSSPLEKPEGLSWNAASVQLPPVPMLAPGPDSMSMTISAVLPTLATPLTASVAALSAKEDMFSGKLGAAQSAYQNADDQGQQSVGQLTSMLGQVGQMAQQAGGPAQALGGQSGTFGSMMQQAMQAAPVAGGGQASAGPTGAGAAAPHARDEAAARGREPAQRPPVEAAGPGDGGRHTAGPPPVAPPERPHRDGEDDLARTM
jgi:hypothetical protein